MNQAKRRFIEEYIEKIERAITAYDQVDPSCQDLQEDIVFDLLIEVRNVFQSDMPNIDDAILLRRGTAIRDAKSVVGILKYYLIDCDDDQGNHPLQSSPSVKNDVGGIHHAQRKRTKLSFLYN